MKVARVRRGPQPRLTSPFGVGGTTPQPALDDLSDVDTTGVSDGDTIVFDDATDTWIPGTASGGTRPPFNYVLAADDTEAALQAIADAVCDGTADNVEINAAIAAMVAATEPYSILLLPGTYHIAASIDFTGLTAKGGVWNVFEASGTVFYASANLTTMVKLDPGAGGQIITCADIRLGALDGNDGTNTVTQLINLARFNDNMLRIEDVRNGSGHGIHVSQAGVSDYPCGNNKIDIEIIHGFDGSAFEVSGGTNAMGFQGNTVHIGEVIATANGIVLGGSADQNASHNLFITGPLEHITNSAIYDYCGGNTFLVANLNSNGKNLGGPSRTLRDVFMVNIDHGTSGTIDSAVTDQDYIIDAGVWSGITEFLERTSTPTTPASGQVRIYPKSDGLMYSLDDAGVETLMSGGSTDDIASTAHVHVASETHLSDGATGTYTLDEAFLSGSVIAWNVTSLARLTVTETEPDSATVSPVGSSGDAIVFDYAALAV